MQWQQFLIGEAFRLEAEQDQDGQECLDARVSEAEGGSTLILDLDRLLEFLEGLGSEVAIVRDFFHLQNTAIGSEANLPQLGQVVQPSTDTKVIGVVDGRLGAQSPAFLVVLLEVRVLIIDVQGGGNPLSDNARPASAVGGSLALHLAVKDQLHLFATGIITKPSRRLTTSGRILQSVQSVSRKL